MTPQPNPLAPPPGSRRNRLWLLAIVALFLVPILVALLLNFAGQRPAPTRQHGELLQPPHDLRGFVPQLADGQPYPWDPARRTWRLVATPAPGCDAPCVALAGDLDLVWRLLGRHADRVEVLWAGDWPGDVRAPDTLRLLPPDPSLRAVLPGNVPVGGLPPVYVIDPNGFVVLRYPPGFDPAGLRSDVARLLKLK